VGTDHTAHLCPGPTTTGFAGTGEISRSRLFHDGPMDADALTKAGYDGLRA
jgi:hypothetical protein